MMRRSSELLRLYSSCPFAVLASAGIVTAWSVGYQHMRQSSSLLAYSIGQQPHLKCPQVGLRYLLVQPCARFPLSVLSHVVIGSKSKLLFITKAALVLSNTLKSGVCPRLSFLANILAQEALKLVQE